MMNWHHHLQKGLMAIGLLAIGVLTTGCGGGGAGSVVPPPALLNAVLTGTVTVPSGRGRGTEVPVPGATVRLFNPGTTDQAGDAVTADVNGVYRFTAIPTPGAIYELRAEGTLDGVARRLRAIVRTSPSAAPATPVQANLDAVATVAVDASLRRRLELVDSGSFTNPSGAFDLADIFDDLHDEYERKLAADSSLELPDCSDDSTISGSVDGLLTDLNGAGAYTGTYSDAAGTVLGKFAAIVKEQSVMFVQLRTPLYDDSYNDGGDDDYIEDHPVAYGLLEDNGIISTVTEDSKLQITGTFLAGVGMGEWENLETGDKGTWSVETPVTTVNAFDGVYGGAFSGDSSGQGAGQFTLVIVGGNVSIFSFESLSGFGLFGQGTVNAQGQISFRWQDLDGNTGTSTGSVAEGVATGTLRKSAEESFEWESRSDYDPLGS